jgi:hypothetical protein
MCVECYLKMVIYIHRLLFPVTQVIWNSSESTESIFSSLSWQTRLLYTTLHECTYTYARTTSLWLTFNWEPVSARPSWLFLVQGKSRA